MTKFAPGKPFEPALMECARCPLMATDGGMLCDDCRRALRSGDYIVDRRMVRRTKERNEALGYAADCEPMAKHATKFVNGAG